MQYCWSVEARALCAAWNEHDGVHVFDLREALEALRGGEGEGEESNTHGLAHSGHLSRSARQPARHNANANANAISMPVHSQPLFSYAGHRTQGFALDWSPLTPGIHFHSLFTILSFLFPLSPLVHFKQTINSPLHRFHNVSSFLPTSFSTSCPNYRSSMGDKKLFTYYHNDYKIK